MLATAIVLAVIGALGIAFGAALQERVVVAAPKSRGEITFLLRVAKQPRWLLGAVFAGMGVALHVVALSNGPVSIIQPVGTLGLLFGVVSKAVLDRRPAQPAELLGSAAVVAGLAGLLLALPHHTAPPTLSTGTALALGLGTLIGGTVVLGAVALSDVSRNVRVVLLAVVAGAAFGIGSALVRVIGNRALRDFTAVFDWPTLFVVTLILVGGIAQQHAYRGGRFAVAFAVLLITDPLSASAVGMLVLGEPLPDTALKLAWMSVSAAVIVLGVTMIARSYAGLTLRGSRAEHAHPDRHRHLPTGCQR